MMPNEQRDPQPPNVDFARIEATFDDIAGLPPATRAAALDAALGDRSDLRADVESLLRAHDAMSAGAAEDDPAARPEVGARIGAYRLVERIGEGGMGEVFRAERVDGVFDQRVAVKITRATINRDDAVRRFKIERQILASLQHPNIVTMLDGGATADGLAYFVMEYVEGTPITHYCRDRALPLADRLRLCRTVCGAVQYAHQRGIVHRDLKPGNILIQPDGSPKVLDFGVAKLLHEPTVGDARTVGLLPGPFTPNYASPEQLRGLPVTTACDVYALGVLLYEMVTGTRPYDTHGQPLDRVIELVVHEEPRRPSSTDSDQVPYSARLLRGDLDAIVGKAMSKEPADRYDSAGELAHDISRVLDGDPVLARVPSAGYVLLRLAARHKAIVTVAGLAIVAVLATSAVALWQREQARREQQRAEALFRDVRQLANSLIFKVHDAVVPLPGSTDVRRTIVNEAIAYLERLEGQASDDVSLRLELAAAYRRIGGILGDPQRANLGDRDAALTQYERARAITASLVTAESPYEVVEGFAAANQLLSTLYKQKGDGATAVAMAREATEHAGRYAERNPGDARGAKLVALSRFHLAWALPTRESIPVWQQALEYYEGQLRLQPESDEARRNVALMSKYLGSALGDTGQVEAAVAHHRRAMELDEERLLAAPESRLVQFDAAISITAMASVLERSQGIEAALPLHVRSLDLRRRVAEADPKDVQARERLAYGLAAMVRVQSLRGDVASARAYGREAVAVQQAVLRITGDASARLTLARAWFGLAALEAGHDDAACEAYRRAHQEYTAASGLLDRDREEMQQAARAIANCR